MKNEIREAIVKATGEKVKVYRLETGGWGNYQDGGKTIYQDHELTFL